MDIRAFRARLVYEMAKRLKFPRINDVQLKVYMGNTVSVESYFGEPIDTGEINFKRAFDTTLQRIESYRALVAKFGKPLVEGDVFRLFALYPGDSNNSDQVRLSGDDLRWTDYGYGFLPALDSKFPSKLLAYLQSRQTEIMAHASDLVFKIAALSDQDIEAVADAVLNPKVSIKFINLPAHDIVEILYIERRLHELRVEFVVEAKSRRDTFHRFVQEIQNNGSTHSTPFFGPHGTPLWTKKAA